MQNRDGPYWSLMLLCGDYAESVRASLAFAGLLRPPCSSPIRVVGCKIGTDLRVAGCLLEPDASLWRLCGISSRLSGVRGSSSPPPLPPPSPRRGDLHHTARKAGFNDSARAARSVLLFVSPNPLCAMSNFAITRLDANKKPRSVVYAAGLACWAHAAFVLLSYVNTV